MPSSRCSSGSRGDHDENVAPLTKKTAPTASAAIRPDGPVAAVGGA